MAHEIESMFYLGETPWHGLGNKVQEAPNTAEAIKQAGLDWRVIECPLYMPPLSSGIALVGQQPNPTVSVGTHKALVRQTDGSLLGVVGQGYQPLQNTEAFNFFDPFVSSGLVELETAGSLREGKRIWILARIKENSDIGIVGDDVIRKFIMLSNAHDGSLAVRVGFTPVRVVCANTLAMAHNSNASQFIRLKHSRSVVANLDSLRDVMNVANQSFEATAEEFRKLAAKQINADDLRKYVKIVLGHQETKDDDLSTRAANQIADVVQLFETGRGQKLVGVKGTVWAAYNAVTEYLTHDVSADASKRYDSLWFGGNANRNQLALVEAMKLAA